MLDINDPIHAFEPIWGLWAADDLIGEGNYGRVYRVSRTDDVGSFTSAVKMITVPRSPAEVAAVMATGLTLEEAHARFAQVVKNVVVEIKMLHDLRDCVHVVRYEDHLIRQDGDTRVWHILIRMELLTPLTHYLRTVGMSQLDIARLGIEVCAALEACRARNILHRDIKDANIFIAPDGTFKLGDFGIALEQHRVAGQGPMHGTPLYAAPEVHSGQGCDVTADLYALGLVLYRLCNHNRLPFMPPMPEPLTERHAEMALRQRLRGDRLPKPEGIDEGLWQVIERACAYKREDRYQTAAQMSQALLNVNAKMQGRRVRGKAPDTFPTIATHSINPAKISDMPHLPSHAYIAPHGAVPMPIMDEWANYLPPEPEPPKPSMLRRHAWLIPFVTGLIALAAVAVFAARGGFAAPPTFRVDRIVAREARISAVIECPSAPPDLVSVSVYALDGGALTLVDRRSAVPTEALASRKASVSVDVPGATGAGTYLLQVSAMIDGKTHTVEGQFERE